MTKLLFKHLLLTYAFSVILSIIVLTCVYHLNLNTHDGGQAFLIAVVGSLYSSLLLVLSATTAFLNLQDWIRENIVLRLLSFFLLPILFLLFFLLSEDAPFFSIIILCFVAVRVYFYIRFTKRILKQ